MEPGTWGLLFKLAIDDTEGRGIQVWIWGTKSPRIGMARKLDAQKCGYQCKEAPPGHFDKAACETITANFYFRNVLESNKRDGSDPSSRSTAVGAKLLSAKAAVGVTLWG